MSKVNTLKSVMKKPADKSTYGTNPRDPWSAREGIAEDKALDTYLSTRGINPKFATKDVKIAHSKSNQFLNWKRSHMQEDLTTGRETTDVRSKVAQSPTLKRKNELQKSVKHYIVKSPTGSMHKEDFTDEEVDMLINEVLSKDATAGDWIHDFIHSDNPKFKGKSRKERQRMALGAYYAKQNEEVESLDELSVNTLASYKKKAGQDVNARALKGAMQKDDPLGHPSTPDSREKNLKKRSSRIGFIVKSGEKLKSKGYQEPKPAPDTADRGYGKGRYMGDSVELEGNTLDEVSSELLGRYKEKAKKSADDLTAAGKHRQASDRHMNVMKATGKQMGKTIANIKRALNKEDLMKSARIIKDIYKKKGIKEEMYDHEKDDKGSSSVYGKAPKMGKSKEEAESTNKAAAVLKGGTTLTGKSRDTVEIDPMMRTRPTNGASPEDARSKKSIG